MSWLSIPLDITKFDNRQKKILLGVMVFVICCMAALFAFGIFNIYDVLYKQKKYKDALELKKNQLNSK